MEIRPILTDGDYEEALVEVARMMAMSRGDKEDAELELLAMLVHNYERAKEPLPPLDPIEAIKFRMDQQGLSRKDLLPIFGTTARVSEVLNGKRPLTLEMVRKLHAAFDIPLESLIAPANKRHRAAGPSSRTARKRSRGGAGRRVAASSRAHP